MVATCKIGHAFSSTRKNWARAKTRNQNGLGVPLVAPQTGPQSTLKVSGRGVPGGRGVNGWRRNSGDSESPEFRGPQTARARPGNHPGDELSPRPHPGGGCRRVVRPKNAKPGTLKQKCTEFSKGPLSFSGKRRRWRGVCHSSSDKPLPRAAPRANISPGSVSYFFLFGARPIFSGARKGETNLWCHTTNSSRPFGHRKKLVSRRTAESNQTRGTPSFGRGLA